MNNLDKLNHWVDQPGNAVYLWVGLGVVAIAIFFLYRWLDRRMAPYRTAYLDKAVVSGKLVVYYGTMSGRNNLSDTKIETLNIEDGTVIKTRILYDDKYKILLIADRMIWTKFLQSDSVTSRTPRPFQAKVLDLDTLETRYDNKAVEQHFQFADSEKLADMILDEDGTGIVFVSNAGNTCSFASHEGHVQSPGPTSGTFFGGMGWSAPLSLKRKPDSRRYFICLDGDNIGNESFIEPVWVNGFNNQYVRGIVVVHPQTIDPFPFVSLTLLDVEGKIRWTVTQQSMGIAVVKETDKLTRFAYCGTHLNLVIYKVESRTGSNKIVALNVTDGKIVWTKHF